MSACAPAVPTNDAVIPRRASPTPVESPVAATQSPEPESQTVPAEPAFEARLTAVRSGAKVIRSGGIEIELEQDQMENIQVDDGIEVLSLEEQDEQSYSILDFSDYLEVELFRNTKVFLADLKEVDSSYVTLDLDGGYMFVHLSDQTTSRVTVQTPYTTIEALTGGTEFDVCRTEELTCVVVKNGIVEVKTRNRKQLVKAGEAIQILKDQPPSLPICAPAPTITDWEERYREFADTPALDKEISALPQEPCPLTALGLPVDARILYQDEFINPFSGWARGKIDNFTARYAGLNYYRVQAEEAGNRYLAFIPDEIEYGDVNVDIRAVVEPGSGGDFRYGVVFRRSGNRYYAFAVSPISKTWYFLQNSSGGLEVLEKGKDERMRGLEGRDTLRVEAYGSIFLVFINGRFIYSISDPDYASGEVGLFVETFDSPDAIVRFDSIILWDMSAPVQTPNQGGREYCFNTVDDDGDRLIDRADPDCQRKDPTATPKPPAINTLGPANTPIPANTLAPQPSSTPGPSNTPRTPTRTRPPRTSTPEPSDTPRPPTHRPPTHTPRPSDTPEPPEPTATEEPTQPPDPTDPPTEPPPPTDPPTEPPPPTDPPTEPPVDTPSTGLPIP